MAVDTGGKTGRRPGPTSSRDAILRAARTAFTKRGFKGATLRLIAADAGVDPALIRHFFGDKDGLFDAAMEIPPETVLALLDTFDAPRERWGAELTRRYLALWEDPLTAQPFLTMAASAFANTAALEKLRTFVGSTVLEAVRLRLRDEQAELRFALAMNHLIGIALARHLLKIEPLTALGFDELCALLAPAVQRYLTEPLP